MRQEIVKHTERYEDTTLPKYQVLEGYLVTQLGVTTTQRFEPDMERAMEEAAEKVDVVLVPCVRVRRTR